jgi:AP-3 complex subunit delta
MMQQDVIMDCLEDADISLRLVALKLVVGMVSSETLQLVVNRRINQLQSSPTFTCEIPDGNSFKDVDGDNLEEILTPQDRKPHPLPLPNDFRSEVMHRILDMCSHNNYSNVSDFGWYVNALVQLARLIPPTNASNNDRYANTDNRYELQIDIASRIGTEIRSVAVRVKSARWEATKAAESLIVDNRAALRPTTSVGILGPAAWVAGEFSADLVSPGLALNSLIDVTNISLPPRTLSFYLQAIPKLFIALTSSSQHWYTSERKEISTRLARIINFLEALSAHPDLDVQERATEFLELMRLVREAVDSAPPDAPQLPFLLSSVMPSLFSGLELNPVALNAQRKIPPPENLDLDQSMNDKPRTISTTSYNTWSDAKGKGFQEFYHGLDSGIDSGISVELYAQQPASSYGASGNLVEESGTTVTRRAERRERNRDDPFYIGNEDAPLGNHTPQAVTSPDHGELDVDSIPIMALDHGVTDSTREQLARTNNRSHSTKVEITADETFGVDEPGAEFRGGDEGSRSKRHLLQVDSSGLRRLSLEGSSHPGFNVSPKFTETQNEDIEIRRAMQEVERLRLGMQRAAERIHADDVPPEGALITKKKKKKASHTKR